MNTKRLNCLNNIDAINDDINKYYFDKHVKMENNKFNIENNKKKDIDNYSELSIPVDDLLETNGISDVNNQNQPLSNDNKNSSESNTHRYTKFVSSYIHLNSSCRIMDGEYESVLNTTTIVSASETEFKPESPKAVVHPYPKVCTNGGTQLNCDVNVSNVTIGGRSINVFRNDKTAPIQKPICSCLIPDKHADGCPFIEGDLSRLSKSTLTEKEKDRVIAHHIIKYGKNYNASSEFDKDYIGYESLRDQLLVESNINKPAIVPPTDCDPSIIRVTSNICNNFSYTSTYLQKYSPLMIGGIKGETVVQQTKCVNNSEFNRYLFKLDKRYSNIKLIKMVSCVIPIHDYIINTYNNQIVFQIQSNGELLTDNNNQTIWEYNIPIGNYDATNLASVMEFDINQLIKSNYSTELDIFQIKVDQLRNKFSILTIDGYTFTWRFVVNGDNERTLYRMLGFEHSSQSTFVDQFTNLHPFNLKTNDYLLVKLEGYNTLYDCVTNDRYFNLIKQKYSNCCATTTSIIDQHLNIETVNEYSSGIFEYADFKFYDQWGRPLDFMNREFSIVLLVVEYYDQMNGFNSNTRRGVIDNTSVTKGLIQKL